ncbi:MAG: hypothetical protein P8Y60_05600 [Calditrichota bacterium]
MKAEIAGDTMKINYLTIYPWYLNLDEIRQLISDEDFKNIVYNYLVSSGESMVSNEVFYDVFCVEKNKLCKRFRYKKGLQQPPLVIYKYIDIQSGEIVVSYTSTDSDRLVYVNKITGSS